MRTIEITLSGNKHTVRELPSRKAAAWRKMVQEKLGDVAKMVESAPSTDITDGAALATLVRNVGSLVVGSTDVVVELLFEYAPALQESDEDFYDSELVAAFVEVVKLAYPFGQLGGLLAKFGSGAASRPTSTS